MDETDPHPFGGHHRGAPADLFEPACASLRRENAELGVVRRDDVLRESLQEIDLLLCRENLEVAEAHERGCHAAHDRAGLGLWMAVVEHVAHDGVTGADETQCPRGRHAEMMHRLAAHELAHRRAQDCAAVCCA